MYRRREHAPFSGKQDNPRSIWQPSLRGMERPVRSFESFMRTAPPHQTQPPPDDKPLPAIPTSHVARKATVPALPSKSLYRKTSWKAPSDWDEPNSPKEDPQSPSFSAPRNYELIIPEPSPGVGDDQDSIVWPFNSSPTQHSYLESIDEQGHDRVSSHYRSSDPSSARLAVPENDYCLLDLPASASTIIPPPDLAVISPVVSRSSNMEVFSLPLLPDVVLHSSSSMMKQKAFAKLGIESSANDQEHLPPSTSPSRSLVVGKRNEDILSMRGKKLQPLSQGNLKLEKEEEEDVASERSQQLTVSQDYHNVLADQYYEAHLQDSPPQAGDPVKNTIASRFIKRSSKVPSNTAELVPQPLLWKKDSNGLLPRSSRSNTYADVTPNSQGLRRRHRKISAWVPFHQHTHSESRSSLEEEQARAASDFAHATRREISGVERFRLLNKEKLLSKLSPQVKRLRSATAGDDTTGHSSATIVPTESLSLEQSRPLFRLPGGLAIVRQSPSLMPESQNHSTLDISPPFNTPQTDTHADFSEFDLVPAPRRPSSLYSQQSDVPVVSAIAVRGRLRSSITFPSSSQTRSSTSSPPSSPLANEIEFPRTPPPIPSEHTSRPPPTLSSWSQRDEGKMDDDRADSANEDEPQRRKLHIGMGILDKARDARDSWKRHQKDAKHTKLKQSIRVLGPTDPGDSAAYVRRQGSVLGYSDGHAGRLPGYMDGGLI